MFAYYARNVRVAIDEQIFAIQRFGGISRLFAELARYFITDSTLDVELMPLDAPVVNRYLLDDPTLAPALGLRSARSQWTALAWYFSHIERRRAPLIHSTFYLPHGLASPKGTKRVVTVYDMIPERMPQTRRRLDFLTMKRRYIERADHIICISSATRDDLLDVYGSIARPITVVPLGVDPRFSPKAPRLADLPAQYVLFVGHRGQYKDAPVLIRAFAEIASCHPELKLAFVGGGRFATREADEIAAAGLTDKVVQVDLPDADMPSAYAHASAFVFPSRFEGFGLPALEAMASGVPTILARATSLPEVGGPAARYFTPGDSDELASALDEILDQESTATRMRAEGIEWARRFPWHLTAERTAHVYREALQ